MAETKLITVITGGNSGIGFELANQLMQLNTSHVLLGARSIDKGKAAVKDLESRGLAGTVELLHLDVADEKSIIAAAKAVEQTHGRIDALVNNAGISESKAGKSHAEQMMESFRTNALGADLMGRHFLPLLKKSSGTPRIIHVTSGGGSIGNRLDRNGIGNSMSVMPYRVSKAAMNMIFACQTVEYEEFGVKVFCYGPGYTASAFGPYNTLEHGAKPTSEGTAPMFDMLQGKRDHDVRKYIEYGKETFPW